MKYEDFVDRKDQWEHASFPMRVPELRIPDQPFHKDPLLSDPSGFLRRHFRREDLQRIRDMLQMWLAECIQSSGIPDVITEEGLPESILVYGYGPPVGERGNCSVYGSRSVSKSYDHPGKIRIPPPADESKDAILADIVPDFFQDPIMRQRCRVTMQDVFAGLLSNSFSDPTNLSRDRAWISALADRLPLSIDEGAHPRCDFPDAIEFSPLQTTSGLSAPRGYATTPDTTVASIHHTAGHSAFGDAELSELWPLYAELVHGATESGFLPTIEEQNEAIRRHLPHADTVLAHPSFRETSPGPQAMIFTTRSNVHAVLCSFDVEYDGFLFDAQNAAKTAWNPRLVRFNRPSNPTQSIALMGKHGQSLEASSIGRNVFDAVFTRFSSRTVDKRLVMNPSLNHRCDHYRLRVRNLVADLDREIGPPPVVAKEKKKKK